MWHVYSQREAAAHDGAISRGGWCAPSDTAGQRAPELTGLAFVDWAEPKGIVLRYIQPGKPNQNAFVERFNRSFRYEVLDTNLFNSITQAQEAADAWVMDYNQFRPHDSLDDMTPMEFRSRAFKPGISSFGLST